MNLFRFRRRPPPEGQLSFDDLAPEPAPAPSLFAEPEAEPVRCTETLDIPDDELELRIREWLKGYDER